MTHSELQGDDLFPKCDEQTIGRLESHLSMSFPEDYRQFLLQRNGLFIAGGINFVVGGRRESLSVLFGVALSVEYRSILWARAAREFWERVPEHIVPVGMTRSRCVIAIACGEDDRGTVYLWDPPDDWEDDENIRTYDYLRVVAASFGGFLQSLHPASTQAVQNESIQVAKGDVEVRFSKPQTVDVFAGELLSEKQLAELYVADDMKLGEGWTEVALARPDGERLADLLADCTESAKYADQACDSAAKAGIEKVNAVLLGFNLPIGPLQEILSRIRRLRHLGTFRLHD